MKLFLDGALSGASDLETTISPCSAMGLHGGSTDPLRRGTHRQAATSPLAAPGTSFTTGHLVGITADGPTKSVSAVHYHLLPFAG